MARPSDYELTSRIASAIDGFIDECGLDELLSGSFAIVVRADYTVAISATDFAKKTSPNALIICPLADVDLNRLGVEEGGPIRHFAVDMAARSVILKLPT
jgi:hypothetical protein